MSGLTSEDIRIEKVKERGGDRERDRESVRDRER